MFRLLAGGDFLHTVASSWLMCAAYGMRCRVYIPRPPTADPGASPVEGGPFWCLGDELTLTTRLGESFGIRSKTLSLEMELWPLAQLVTAGLTYHPQAFWVRQLEIVLGAFLAISQLLPRPRHAPVPHSACVKAIGC